MTIDIRSDTVTKPSADMRRAIAEAEVGDEQKFEDPTVNLLQEMVADLLGKEAAVFLPSGTMCNEIALRVHCRPGEEMLAHRTAHPIHFEELELFLEAPDTDAEDQSPRGDAVERAVALRHFEGMVVRQHEDVRGEADPLGERGEVAERRERIVVASASRRFCAP
jgi:threonine aldolase